MQLTALNYSPLFMIGRRFLAALYQFANARTLFLTGAFQWNPLTHIDKNGAIIDGVCPCGPSKARARSNFENEAAASWNTTGSSAVYRTLLICSFCHNTHFHNTNNPYNISTVIIVNVALIYTNVFCFAYLVIFSAFRVLLRDLY